MHFAERTEGEYRIYAGALEAVGGYVAAVVVSRLQGVKNAPREAYRDMAMSGGHRWRTPHEALAYAVARASEVIRSEPHRLAC